MIVEYDGFPEDNLPTGFPEVFVDALGEEDETVLKVDGINYLVNRDGSDIIVHKSVATFDTEEECKAYIDKLIAVEKMVDEI